MQQPKSLVVTLAEDGVAWEHAGPSTRSVVILLAEDDEGHALLVLRNLRRAGVTNEIIHVTDGQAALDFIRCDGTYAGRVQDRALLLLLDINMPRLDGVEALRQLKADPATQQIPVIMLTTTDSPQEIQRCYSLGCSAYVTKPVPSAEFVAAIQQLGLFLQIVQVPLETAGRHGESPR